MSETYDIDGYVEAGAERAALTECADGSEVTEFHCGDDCGGYYDEDSGEWDEPVDCEHCGCCTCNPCSYARVG